MKTKLYHKFLKMCCKTFPEHHLNCKTLFTFKDRFVTWRKDDEHDDISKANVIFYVNNDNIRAILWGSFGYAEHFREKYKRFTRKYNSPQARLERAIKNEKD